LGGGVERKGTWAGLGGETSLLKRKRSDHDGKQKKGKHG